MNSWISVKDKLPDNKQTTYLVTINCGYVSPFVDFATWRIIGKVEGVWGFDRGCVTAWQKIPEPYEENREEIINNGRML